MQIPFITASGKMVDLKDMKEEDIVLEDIAGALSKLCRYNGQCGAFYSVAEHSLLLSEYALANGMSEELQKALLLHDAAEAYLGDMVYHLKAQFPVFQDLDVEITQLIFKKFGVNYWLTRDEVHRLDRSICVDEMYQLMPMIDRALFNHSEINKLGITIQGMLPHSAKTSWYGRAEYLQLNNGENNDQDIPI